MQLDETSGPGLPPGGSAGIEWGHKLDLEGFCAPLCVGLTH